MHRVQAEVQKQGTQAHWPRPDSRWEILHFECKGSSSIIPVKQH